METPAFTQTQRTKRIAQVPFVELFRTHTKNTLLGLGARYIEGVTFNIYGVFIVGYLTNTLKMPRQDALAGVMIASAIMIVMLPIYGSLSDRIGRRRLFGVAALLIGVLSFPAFDDGTEVAIADVDRDRGAVRVVYPAVYGPQAALFSELFDTRVAPAASRSCINSPAYSRAG